MAGNLFDLDDPSTILPNRFIVDTNVIVERVFASLILRTPAPNPLQAQQAATFFQTLSATRKAGFVLQTVYAELVHVVIGYSLNQFGMHQNPRLSRLQVYKRIPGYIKTLEPALQQLRFFPRYKRSPCRFARCAAANRPCDDVRQPPHRALLRFRLGYCGRHDPIRGEAARR